MKSRMTFYEQMDEYTTKGIPYFFLIDFDQKNPRLYPLDKLQNQSEIYFKFPSLEYSLPMSYSPPLLHVDKSPMSMENYRIQFDSIISHLHRGDSFLINLTCETPIFSNLGLGEIYQQAKAKYKIWLKNKFVCFSPETFIKISNNRISTFPMKGTIDASIPHAEELLLADPKESAEHATIVDLLRNDLSLVADNVCVKRYRYFDRIKTGDKELLQMSSEIEGEIQAQYQNHFGLILEQLLPAGSISGAPKKRTVELINEVEMHQRGYYTGVCGIFDGQDLDSCVLIRFVEERDDKLYYKSGGGITFMSEMEYEYQEMKDKIYVPVD